MPAPKLSADQADRIRTVYAECGTVAETSRRTGNAVGTVRNVVRAPGSPGPPAPLPSQPSVVSLPTPAPEAGGPTLPEPFPTAWEPFRVDDPGTWLVLSDVHLPFHDPETIRRAVAEAKARGVVGVLLNGDVFDFYEVSHHYREPDGPRLVDEIAKGRQLFDWLRAELPRVRIVYKEGNHDFRLRCYVAERAPALFGLEETTLPFLLHMADRGVEWVDDKRVVMLGKLPVVHGHEFKGWGGVMPARWLYLKTGSTALCGHFHQPSNYTFRTLKEEEIGCWSTGCACFLHPQYLPTNQWGHGWAVVEIHPGGAFTVTNRRLLKDGRIT